MRASECPASNCSIKSLMLAAMSSCLVLGFLLSMADVLGGGCAAHGVSPLRVAFAFHAVRGMYLHAERHLAKAGGSKCKERGITHPWSAAERASAAEGCTSEARKPGETPCAREGRRP